MIRNIYVEETYNDMRLDRFIRSIYGKIPQSLIEKSIRNGKIKINGKKSKSSNKIKFQDKISFFNFKFSEKYKKKEKLKISSKIIKDKENRIIDDNENFIVLNKDSGIPVQGGTKSKKNLIDIFKKSNYFSSDKPYTVHRLDKDTSGLLIIAKNRKSAQLLTSLFRLRKIQKTYLAICYGDIKNKLGKLDSQLIRFEQDKKISERAITNFKTIDQNNKISFLKLNPITGRKHQIRKQLFQIGNPVLGDNKYRNLFVRDNKKNLMLHAYKLKFMIGSKKYTYKAPLPEYFIKFLQSKRINFQNI